MAKKKSTPSIVKAYPNSHSFRSSSLGCTLLFDAEHEPVIRAKRYNPFLVCFNQDPPGAFEDICELAKLGIWFAVESHPLIADADGVPGMDIVVAKKASPPKEGIWLTAGSQLLDLPSGTLKIAYEQEFFEDWYLDEFPSFDASDPNSQSFEVAGFSDATNYSISIEPGKYVGHVYTRDLYKDSSSDGRHADLAIVLVSTQRRGSSKGVVPLIPFSG